MSHFKDLVDCLLLNGLLPSTFFLGHLDSYLSGLQSFVNRYPCFQVCLLQRLNPLLFALHHSEQLVQVNVFKHLELAGLLLQFVQPL